MVSGKAPGEAVRVSGGKLQVGNRLRATALLSVLVPDRAGERALPVPVEDTEPGRPGEPQETGQAGAAGCREGGRAGDAPIPLVLRGRAHGFAAEAVWTPRPGEDAPYWDVDLRVRYEGEVPAEAALRVSFDLLGPGRPTWLIPGVFYGQNRLPHCSRIYPRYDFAGGDPQQLVSDRWSFRADRAAVPAIFAWNEDGSAALSTAETSPLGITGVGFAGNADGTRIWLDFPFREEPVTYLAPGTPGPADRPRHRFSPGEEVLLRFRVWVGGSEPHAYAPFVRQLYRLDRGAHPLRPWMGLRRAAGLTAYGLYRWHYKPDLAILCETAPFDRESGAQDRLNMHVGWVSGTPWLHALLEYGRTHGREEYVEAAVAVMDKIASGLAPAGIFWGEWRQGRGWSQGWTPHKGWVHARTIAEATLFMVRALAAEQERGVNHPAWAAAVLSNLLYVCRVQRADGALGAYYHAESGEVMDWEGAGGLLWIAALLEAAEVMEKVADALTQEGVPSGGDARPPVECGALDGALCSAGCGSHAAALHGMGGQSPELAQPSAGGRAQAVRALAARFRDAALRAGQYYRRFVDEAFLYGAPEDVHLCPTSEDGYNAVIAYVRLYEETGDPRWLAVARDAADWTMTFRWTYNLAFPTHTMLAQFDFRSRGADLASPSNQHLHNYGLIALPEMLRLWRHTGDDYYLERTRDNLACFLQFIAREDGDFNAYKGMVTERYYNTNCFQPKGMLLTLSHAWSVGAVLYAAQEAARYEAEWGIDLGLPEE